MYDPSELLRAASSIYGDSDYRLFFCPGRVNLIGEHLDYNGGLVMPGAISLGIYGVVSRREDHLIKLTSLQASRPFTGSLTAELSYESEDGWANYPKGVIKALIEAGVDLPGANILYASTLPMGIGLSSSAAVEVLTAEMFLELSNSKMSRTEIALLCQKVENKYIGVNSGIMDQLAVAAGKKNHCLLLNCLNLEYEEIPFELNQYDLIILDSKKARELTRSDYNSRRGECEAALAEVRKKRSLDYLARASIQDLDDIVDPILHRRAKHVITEQARVITAAESLKAGEIPALGELMLQSHMSLKNDFEVSIPELDLLVELAMKHGAVGGRMTGAGFGGCIIALLPIGAAETFMAQVGAGYREATNLEANFYAVSLEDGVKEITASA